MKVLLFQPNTSTLRGTLCPPFGLMYVGAVAREAGHEVMILDRNIDYFSLKKMKGFNPDVVGITAMTGPMLLDAVEVSRQAKRILGNHVPVVWGGVHATILPEQTLENDYVDFVVVGEGEYTFRELLEVLGRRGKDFRQIEGLAFKESGTVIVNQPRPVIKNLDELPLLPWDLVCARQYFSIEIVSKGLVW